MSRTAHRITLACVFIAALIAGLATMYTLRVRPHESAADIGAPFSLTDQNGATVTRDSFHGKLMLLTFGYTACPDICPGQLELMRAALNKLGDKASNIAPVFVTLDPDYDNVQRLHDYMAVFNEKKPAITGLTGPMPAIDALAKSYAIYHARNPVPGTPGAYTIDHSVTIFLMDSNGHFVQSFTTPTPDELAAGLTDALNRYL